MSGNPLPIAARDIGALMSLGPLQQVGHYPLTIVCLVKRAGGADSIWLDLSYPAMNYEELWRLAYPGKMIPAGCKVAPLVSRPSARRDGFGLAQVGLITIAGANDRFDGEYFVQGVTHKYHHGSGGAGFTTSDGRFRYGA